MNNINIFLILVGIVLIFLIKSFKVVPVGYEWIVEDFKRPRKKTLKSGVHFIFPIISKIRNKVSMQENNMRLPPQSVITAENNKISVEMHVFYRVVDPIKAAYSTENLRQDLSSSLQKSALNVSSEMNIDEILKARDDFSKEILMRIEDVNELYGCIINRVEIVNIKLPKDIEELYKKKNEEQKLIKSNLFYQDEKKMNLENTNINKNWCEKFKGAWEIKNINEFIDLFEKNVKYYKDSNTRLYSLNEIKDEWTEVFNEDYKKIDINMELENEKSFIINIKAEERLVHNIIAKVELNSEGKCIYFKKWEENL